MTTLYTTNPHTARALAEAVRRGKVQAARERFDLEATWAALPPPCAEPAPTRPRGAAGYRLRGHLRTSWPEPLLKEFARETLGAVRIREGYLDALRVVLGNQAHAERHGYTLEQNIRVDFASVQVMRTINAQMKAAGITEDRPVGLGAGRVQTVQCFIPDRRPKAEDLCAVLRREEEQAARLWKLLPPKASMPACITAEDVPY